jgi:hypothetical protein
MLAAILFGKETKSCLAQLFRNKDRPLVQT